MYIQWLLVDIPYVLWVLREQTMASHRQQAQVISVSLLEWNCPCPRDRLIPRPLLVDTILAGGETVVFQKLHVVLDASRVSADTNTDCLYTPFACGDRGSQGKRDFLRAPGVSSRG